MSVVVLQVFVSLMLVAGSIVLFVHSVRQRDLEHADRLSLAPLEDDLVASDVQSAPASSDESRHESRHKEGLERACKRHG